MWSGRLPWLCRDHLASWRIGRKVSPRVLFLPMPFMFMCICWLHWSNRINDRAISFWWANKQQTPAILSRLQSYRGDVSRIHQGHCGHCVRMWGKARPLTVAGQMRSENNQNKYFLQFIDQCFVEIWFVITSTRRNIRIPVIHNTTRWPKPKANH